MKTVALLLLVVAVSAAKNSLQRLVVTQEDGSIIIDNDAEVTGAITRLNVRCSSDRAILTLERTAEDLAGQAQIQVGDVATAPGCVSTLADIPVTPATEGAGVTFTATAAACGGVSDLQGATTVYTWNVHVIAVYSVTVDGAASTREVESTFPVRCRSEAQTPPPVTNLPLVEEVTAVSVQFAQTITFNLAPDTTNTNPRLWVLNLSPADDNTLRGLSYRLVDLTASAPGVVVEGETVPATPFSARLIVNGCIRDTSGVRVTKVTGADDALTETISITIARFQFTANPSAQISFTATVNLCTPDQPGGVCSAIVGCPGPAPGTKIGVSNSNLLNHPENTASAKTTFAVGSSRPRRSLNRFSLGQLSAQLV